MFDVKDQKAILGVWYTPTIVALCLRQPFYSHA